ncbi:unnamed protein product [Owenia fusiformis]|uniref:Uncharacterized protein n=1 Tax=Owenia fusiformis TaxID=6347 RepID=A0A8J1XTL3_OWEFU|nr:unnamed protein product [Owenia fusiformis]
MDKFLSTILLLTLTAYTSRAIVEPKDHATREGVSVTFTCDPGQPEPQEYIQWWEFVTSSTTPNLIFNPAKPNEYDSTRYDFANAGRNFTIKSPMLSAGGKYECRRLVDASNHPVELIVLKSPDCRNQRASNPPHEGENAELTCQVEYRGNRVPVPMWYTEQGSQLPMQYARDVTGVAVKSTNFTTNDQHDDTLPRCQVTVAGTPYNDNCTLSSPMRVIYSVRDVDIHHDYDGPGMPRFATGDKLNCTARGYPDPEFTWSKVKGRGANMTMNGFQFEVPRGLSGEYTFMCTAFNTVNRTDYNSTKDITFVATGYTGGSQSMFGLSVMLLTVVSILQIVLQ